MCSRHWTYSGQKYRQNIGWWKTVKRYIDSVGQKRHYLDRVCIVYFNKSLICNRNTIKPVLSGHWKRRPKLVFRTNYGLMQVKSIAECSKGSILQYFRPSLSYHLSLIPLFCLFLSGRLRQVLLYIIIWKSKPVTPQNVNDPSNLYHISYWMEDANSLERINYFLCFCSLHVHGSRGQWRRWFTCWNQRKIYSYKNTRQVCFQTVELFIPGW